MELPLRSLLFAPANEPRKVEKVATFGADAVILDLEDAVPDAEKVATRALARRALSTMGGDGLVCVRVNGLRAEGTELFSAELTMLPQSTIPVDGGEARKVLQVIETLEDLEDVQNVYANFDIPEEVMASL